MNNPLNKKPMLNNANVPDKFMESSPDGLELIETRRCFLVRSGVALWTAGMMHFSPILSTINQAYADICTPSNWNVCAGGASAQDTCYPEDYCPGGQLPEDQCIATDQCPSGAFTGGEDLCGTSLPSTWGDVCPSGVSADDICLVTQPNTDQCNSGGPIDDYCPPNGGVSQDLCPGGDDFADNCGDNDEGDVCTPGTWYQWGLSAKDNCNITVQTDICSTILPLDDDACPSGTNSPSGSGFADKCTEGPQGTDTCPGLDGGSSMDLCANVNHDDLCPGDGSGDECYASTDDICVGGSHNVDNCLSGEGYEDECPGGMPSQDFCIGGHSQSDECPGGISCADEEP